MPHNNHRSVHRTAIFLGVLLVLILAHLVLLLAQAHPPSHSHLRAEGRWPGVRHSLGLPPLAARVKPASKLPPLGLHISSRFDLKHKRALEESLLNVDAPPQLYFAPDALLDEIETHDELVVVTVELKETKRRGRNERGGARIRTQGS